MVKILELFEIGLKAAIKVLQWAIIGENETIENVIFKKHTESFSKQMKDIKKTPMEISELKIKVTKK